MKKKKWMKKIVISSLLGVLGISLAGCGQIISEADFAKLSSTSKELTKEVQSESEAPAKYLEDYVPGTLNFSVELFKECAESRADEAKNVMISPMSIQLALAIAANGADGETLAHLEELLCSGDALPEGMSVDELNKNLSLYVKTLSEEENAVIQYGNSVWIRDDKDKITVKPDFLKRIQIFDADAYMAPFNDATVKDMNTWSRIQTKGMIPVLLDNISDNAVIYILNAVAFEGKWADPFLEEYADEDFIFTAADGMKQTVTGMEGEASYYLEDENVRGFVKYYEGARYAFAALLPEQEMNIDDYIKSMTSESFQALFENKRGIDVYITMPQFTGDYSLVLNNILSDMGIADAFSEKADFTRMADVGDEILKIENVIQKTHIEVDMEGTKAAAETEIEMVATTCAGPSESEEVCLNRPFVYAIMDMETNLPLFVGVLNTVE